MAVYGPAGVPFVIVLVRHGFVNVIDKQPAPRQGGVIAHLLPVLHQEVFIPHDPVGPEAEGLGVGFDLANRLIQYIGGDIGRRHVAHLDMAPGIGEGGRVTQVAVPAAAGHEAPAPQAR